MTEHPLDPGRGAEEPTAGEPVAREEELREGFQALRRDLTARDAIPDFATMVAAARAEAGDAAPAASPARPPVLASLPWVPLAAAAAIVAVFLVGRPGSDADAEFERLVSDYRALATTGVLRSPTESLLDIPGVDLGAVPSFGRSRSGGAPGSASPEGRRP